MDKHSNIKENTLGSNKKRGSLTASAGAVSGHKTRSKQANDSIVSSSSSSKPKQFREPLIKVLTSEQLDERCKQVEAQKVEEI